MSAITVLRKNKENKIKKNGFFFRFFREVKYKFEHIDVV